MADIRRSSFVFCRVFSEIVAGFSKNFEEEADVDGKPSFASRFALMTIAGLAAVACVTTAVAPVSGQSSPPGLWTMKAPLPAVRGETAAVEFDGKLQEIGGSMGGIAGPYHEEYDPATDSWRPRAPLPESRDHVAVAIAGNKIYAFGGFVATVHKGAGASAFEYDPANDTWRR